MDIRDVSINFIGINHLIWITELYIKGQSRLEDILTGKSDVYEAKNIPSFGWELDFLQSLGSLP
ncbi:6-phospho-beta-glucosidase, partial [Staphylococcus sp. SIMBA_130]